MNAATEQPSVHSPSRHIKSSSICALPTESPNATRKRSATWAEVQSPASAKQSAMNATERSQPPSPTVQRGFISPGFASPITGDGLQSPTKELVEFAADARRERKVLDLEISNSSLLAINRSLEREIKKHKAELKRYRRLSRAGRFSMATDSIANGDYDEGDGLPHVEGAFEGRPSSPFQEEVSDLESSNEESSEDGGAPSPGADTTKEERQRAKDEAQLRADLRKHRELLLDTARMNRSLQRCLTWTEDLIKDGKKALDHRIPSEEIRLGGRVLNADESEDERVEDETSVLDHSTDFSPEADHRDDVAHDLEGIEAFMGMGAWQIPKPQRLSTESETTNRDSGVDMGRQQQPQHRPVLMRAG